MCVLLYQNDSPKNPKGPDVLHQKRPDQWRRMDFCLKAQWREHPVVWCCLLPLSRNLEVLLTPDSTHVHENGWPDTCMTTGNQQKTWHDPTCRITKYTFQNDCTFTHVWLMCQTFRFLAVLLPGPCLALYCLEKPWILLLGLSCVFECALTKGRVPENYQGLPKQVCPLYANRYGTLRLLLVAPLHMRKTNTFATKRDTSGTHLVFVTFCVFFLPVFCLGSHDMIGIVPGSFWQVSVKICQTLPLRLQRNLYAARW